MDLGLTDKVALVTGASTGIGRATALMLADEGASVLGVSRRSPAEAHERIAHLEVDLSDPDAPRRAVDRTLELYGRLDVVVNNAAGGTFHDGFLGEDLDSWIETLNLNLLAAVRTMQATIPHLMTHGGVIVNVTSVNSRLPSDDAPAYSASKAALLNVGKAVATEYAARGVRVVTVSPGLTATPMWLGPNGVASQIATRSGTQASDVAGAAAKSTPLGRFLTPEEIAACICFAASSKASALTGTELVVDGGVTPTM